MSFAIRNLSVLSYAQGFTHWHYCANVDTLSATMVKAAPLAEVLAEGFFAPMADATAPGDMILISALDGGAQVYVVSTTPMVISVMARTV